MPKTKKDLKPFNAVIQICPDCGKIDVYKDDGHECDREYQDYLNESRGYGDNS